MTESTAPNTIVLIHGLWMTPRSWEQWIPYYESRGYRVLAPGYPGFEVEVEALRADPSPIASLTVPETIAHLERVIAELDRPPIIMGHSFGGTLTQLLLDRGHGAAGVAINSAPTEGVHVNPLSQIKSLFPILKNPANHAKAVGFTPEEFRYAFTNTLSDDEAAGVYQRYHIPAPASWVWAYGLLANLTPGRQETWVDYHNNARAPLLFIAGGSDHIMPPSVNQSNLKHYKSATITEYKEFPGRSHFTCGEAGWEAVADYALTWAIEHTSSASQQSGIEAEAT
jgi:pimeloyl-ACP methyl ester carboxylesterase